MPGCDASFESFSLVYFKHQLELLVRQSTVCTCYECSFSKIVSVIKLCNLKAFNDYVLMKSFSIIRIITVQPKNNARARTSFCVRKKKFFLQLIAGRLSLSPGNRKNFFAAA